MKLKAPPFKIEGLNIRRTYSSWRERYRKGTLLRYYLNKPKDDQRSILGKSLDTLGGMLLLWLACFILLSSLTGQPVKALGFSIPLLAAGALLMKRLIKITEQKRGVRKKFWLAGQKITEEIQKMDSDKEFIDYVRDVMSGLPDFLESDPKKTQKNKPAPSSDSRGIDLEGFYKGVPLAIRCKLQKDDQKIDAGEIRAFAGALRLAGHKNGLFITSGVFHAGVLPVVRDAARKGINIKLVNRYRLIDLARTAGSGNFRTEEGANGRPAGLAGNRSPLRLAAFRDEAFGTRKKARNYMIYGLLLYGGCVFLKGSTVLSLAYLFFAVLNFLAGAYSFFYSKTIDGPDPFEGLETENRQ